MEPIFANIAIWDNIFPILHILRNMIIMFACSCFFTFQGVKSEGENRLLSFSTQIYRQYFDIYFEEVTKCRFNQSVRL